MPKPLLNLHSGSHTTSFADTLNRPFKYTTQSNNGFENNQHIYNTTKSTMSNNGGYDNTMGNEGGYFTNKNYSSAR